MGYTIERTKPGDEAALACIQTQSWKAAFRDILSQDELERCTDAEKATAMYRRLLEGNQGNGYLLRLDGEPHCIAWWDAARDERFRGCAELICIHSLPDHWRKGYGSKMMDRVLLDAAAAGYGRIILWVFADNARARRFYEAKGFACNGAEKTGILPREICYERSLRNLTGEE